MGHAASIPNEGGATNATADVTNSTAATGKKNRNRRGTQDASQMSGGSCKNLAKNGGDDSDVVPSWIGFDDGSMEVRSCGNPLVVNFCAFTKQGFSPYSKKPNQDSLVLFEDPESGALMFGTLDGHGKDGHLVSQYFAKRLPHVIFQHPDYKTDPKKAIAEGIEKIEKRLLKESGPYGEDGSLCETTYKKKCNIDCSLSGTTFVMGIVQGDKLILANIGDSRCIAGVQGADGKIKAKEYTTDHKPDSPGEKQRILAAGGRVFAITYDDGVEGPQRVWLGNVDLPGIAMARSLGDTVAHTAGVSSVPEFTEYTLDASVKTIIMATDGLWEFLSNEEVIQLWKDGDMDVAKAMKICCDKSSKLWMTEEGVVDDTTIIIANIDAGKKKSSGEAGTAAGAEEAKAE